MTLVTAQWLEDALTSVLTATGLGADAARAVAEALAEADLAGVPSHGAMLLPMYVDRLRAGSVSLAERAETVSDRGAVAVLDGGHALGQLTAAQAMALAVDKARQFGVGIVTVRRAFHFGRAGRYAEQAADAGCIGLVASNTKPLMPAIGGAEPVVGNNPLAVAVPSEAGPRLVLDMALSEAALGKIRLAEAEGRPIPDTWATDAEGAPTTDPTAAIKGMLLPTGGAKGLGLALVVDVLTGVLSGGAFGAQVAGLYADVTKPNDCAHVFLAVDTSFFGEPGEFGARMQEFTDGVVGSRRRDGFDRIMVPGQPEAERKARALRDGVEVEDSVLRAIYSTAETVGAVVPDREDAA